MREKLIELLWGNHNDHPSAFSGLTDEFEHEVDYLIAHGVTIREKGERELNHIGAGHYWTCSVCGKSPCIYITEDTNFCPNCGADMRGEKE